MSTAKNQVPNGWRLTVNYKDAGNVISFELMGNQQAIRTGLGMVSLTMGTKIQKLIADGKITPELLSEAMKLQAIQMGGPILEYKGKFLQIEPVHCAAGLQSSINMEWSD